MLTTLKLGYSKIKDLAGKSTINLIILIILGLLSFYFLSSQIVKIYKYFKASYQGASSELTDEQTETIVNKLLEAFDNTLSPFNYEEVRQALHGLTTADYYRVKAKFGHHNRGFILGDVFKGLGSTWLSESLDLNQWLVKELSNQDLEDLRNDNPNLPI